jgi:hypothetical protein
MREFATADVKKLLDEAKVWDNPLSMDLWKKAGIWPDQIPMWANIGSRMQSGRMLSNDATKPSEQEQIYTHPSSVAARR